MEDLIKSIGFTEKCGAEEFKARRIILINKPFAWSSFDVVNKIRIQLRTHLGIRKIKVGHAGTLDPLATGLLIICTGKATKQIDNIIGADKEYVANISFGATTPSYDLETEPDRLFDTTGITTESIEKVLMNFLGFQMQAPPIFSAIKKDGKKSYEQARKGIEIELDKRKVEFKELELLEYNAPCAVVRIVCSKGTYIRSFAHDLGAAMGSGAHLSGLVRTAIGSLRIKDAMEIEQFENILSEMSTI